MAVPAYGLENVGVREENLGEYTARLTVTGTTSTELTWLRLDGKPQKSAPAAVKKEHAEELKELSAAAKDIQKMLPAQRDRIDGLFLQRKTWPLPVWRERYLDHPLVGTLARRLIWQFTTGRRAAAGIWLDDRLVGADDRPLTGLGDKTTVELWHPIGRPVEEVLAWREWLQAHEVRQPFKQAHRELYLLTEAERRTRTYSNRYAAHILRQHQFNVLCAARGWKNQLRLMVDADYPPAMRVLPEWGLRAEYWVEGAGDNHGTDTNETGTYLYLATDQVRFYPLEAARRLVHAVVITRMAPRGAIRPWLWKTCRRLSFRKSCVMWICSSASLASGTTPTGPTVDPRGAIAITGRAIRSVTSRPPPRPAGKRSSDSCRG